MSSVDPLVTAEWLKNNIHAPDVRVVDATSPSVVAISEGSGSPTKPTSGREQYLSAHIPNAVYFDIKEIADPDSNLPHMLPDPVLFSSRARKLGLGDGNRLVIYDSNGYFASARVWWMFRAMGHKDVKVLDGGLAAWTAIGGATEDLPPIAVERHYTARRRADLVKDMDQVRSAIKAGTAQILDARAQGRFDGTAPEPRASLKSGHMQGASCVPTSSLINSDGTIKSAADLLQILGDYAYGPVITTCGSGVSAAIINLALARIGNWESALYDGSWTEWASNPENPIATL